MSKPISLQGEDKGSWIWESGKAEKRKKQIIVFTEDEVGEKSEKSDKRNMTSYYLRLVMEMSVIAKCFRLT